MATAVRLEGAVNYPITEETSEELCARLVASGIVAEAYAVDAREPMAGYGGDRVVVTRPHFRELYRWRLTGDFPSDFYPLALTAYDTDGGTAVVLLDTESAKQLVNALVVIIAAAEREGA
jgi:hypothetical protein